MDKEYAPGIPSKIIKSRIPSIKEPEKWTLAIQEHKARRAGCFDGETQILMSNGASKAIRDIDIGDLVATPNGSKRVARLWYNGPCEEWVEVKYKDKVVICTPTHPFFVSGLGWVPIWHLNNLGAVLCHGGELHVNRKAMLYLQGNIYSTIFQGIKNDMRPHLQGEAWALKGKQKANAKTWDSWEGESFQFNKRVASPEKSLKIPDPKRYRMDKKTVRDKKFRRNRLNGWVLKDGNNISNELLWDETKIENKSWRDGKIQNYGPPKLALEGGGIQRESNRTWWAQLFKSHTKKNNYRKARIPVRVLREGKRKTGSPPLETLYLFNGLVRRKPYSSVHKMPRKSRKNIYGTCGEILRISWLPRIKRERYDIEVEDSHCYYAGGFLVHNSHYDVRLVAPNGVAYSWASRKNPLSEDGRRLLIRQPDHTAAYALGFSGTIKEGYGAGKVDLIHRAPVQVARANDNLIHLSTFSGRQPHEFILVNTGGDKWILQKKEDLVSKVKQFLPEREKYGKIKNIKDAIKGSGVLTPKIDGALGTVMLVGGQPPRVFSPRESVRGESLEYTHRIKDLISKKVPKELDGYIIRGEVYGTDKKTGKVLKHNQIAGLLNSSHWNVPKDVDMKVALFPSFVNNKNGGKVPLDKRIEILDKISKHFGGVMHPIPAAKTEKEKRLLVSAIKNKLYPLTSEGVVLFREGAPPSKIKFEEDYGDVYIRGFMPGQNRLSNSVGAFVYSHTKDGPIVGKVGTGLSDKLRAEMASNPKEFIGRVARIKAQGKYSSGAYRAPVFFDLHTDK